MDREKPCADGQTKARRGRWKWLLALALAACVLLAPFAKRAVRKLPNLYEAFTQAVDVSKQSYEEELALFRRYGAALKRRATEMGRRFCRAINGPSSKTRVFPVFSRLPGVLARQFSNVRQIISAGPSQFCCSGLKIS